MGQVRLDGAFVVGPPSVSGGSFPSAQIITQLAMRDGSVKLFDAASGVVQQQIDVDAPSYVTLSAASVVARGDLLYLRSDSAIVLRITRDDGVGGDVVILVPVHGLLILEFQETLFMKLLEAQGSALIEYFVAGRGPA